MGKASTRSRAARAASSVVHSEAAGSLQRGRGAAKRIPLAHVAACALVLAGYYAMALGAASRKSVTFDELAHLTAGYTYWAFNDYRIHPENGNWPQRWAALPVVLGDYQFPSLDQPAWPRSDMYGLGDQFFYGSGNDAHIMLMRGRAMTALLGVALGALVFAWSWRLTSPVGAWLSLLLFAFSPNLLAHGALVTSDMAAALFFTGAVGATWAVLHRLTLPRLLGSAVLVAGVFLSKFSGPVLIPMLALMAVVRLADGRPLAIRWRGRDVQWATRGRLAAAFCGVLLVQGLVAWTLIWASYGFRYTAFAAATTPGDAFMAPLSEHPDAAMTFARQLGDYGLIPEAYAYGLENTLNYASHRAAFLNGRFSTTGWWWFFPYAFLIKTTLPALAIGLLAFAALLARWLMPVRTPDPAAEPSRLRHVAISLYAGTPLVVLVAVYFAFALTSHLNIGLRHLLPIYPALCVLGGGAGYWCKPLVGRRRVRDVTQAVPASKRGSRAAASAPLTPAGASPAWVWAAGALVLALLAWHALESIRIAPSYLAYFNQLVGGPSQGYKHLVDSSLDWGQDLPALKRWLDEHGLQPQGQPKVYLSYFGTGHPEYYGIDAVPLMGFVDRQPPGPLAPLGGGVYCISATMLNEVAPRPWTEQMETGYRRLRQNVRIYESSAGDMQKRSALLAQTGQEYWSRTYKQLDSVRLGRLAAFLRQREPDDQVGYSILVYRLTDAQVAAALDGPAPTERPE